MGRHTPHTQGHEMWVSTLILFQSLQLQENKFILNQINVTLHIRAPLLRLKVKKNIKTRKNNPCHRPFSQRPFWTWGQASCKYTYSSRWSPPTSEQPWSVCTWLVQRIPFGLYALKPHDDAQQQVPQEEALLLTQALWRQAPPLVEDQAARWWRRCSRLLLHK